MSALSICISKIAHCRHYEVYFLPLLLPPAALMKGISQLIIILCCWEACLSAMCEALGPAQGQPGPGTVLTSRAFHCWHGRCTVCTYIVGQEIISRPTFPGDGIELWCMAMPADGVVQGHARIAWLSSSNCVRIRAISSDFFLNSAKLYALNMGQIS